MRRQNAVSAPASWVSSSTRSLQPQSLPGQGSGVRSAAVTASASAGRSRVVGTAARAGTCSTCFASHVQGTCAGIVKGVKAGEARYPWRAPSSP